MTGTEHLYRYSPRSLRGDMVRAAFGIVLCGAPPAMGWVVQSLTVGVMLTLSALFTVYALMTAWRWKTRVAVSQTGLTVTGTRYRYIEWSRLKALSLAYYATRRDGEKGWMQLRLRGDSGGTVRIDSSLEGFDAIVRRAADVALESGLTLSPATVDNLSSLGIVPPEMETAP
jgi:hypothetical protein